MVWQVLWRCSALSPSHYPAYRPGYPSLHLDPRQTTGRLTQRDCGEFVQLYGQLKHLSTAVYCKLCQITMVTICMVLMAEFVEMNSALRCFMTSCSGQQLQNWMCYVTWGWINLRSPTIQQINDCFSHMSCSVCHQRVVDWKWFTTWVHDPSLLLTTRLISRGGW